MRYTIPEEGASDDEFADFITGGGGGGGFNTKTSSRTRGPSLLLRNTNSTGGGGGVTLEPFPENPYMKSQHRLYSVLNDSPKIKLTQRKTSLPVPSPSYHRPQSKILSLQNRDQALISNQRNSLCYNRTAGAPSLRSRSNSYGFDISMLIVNSSDDDDDDDDDNNDNDSENENNDTNNNRLYANENTSLGNGLYTGSFEDFKGRFEKKIVLGSNQGYIEKESNQNKHTKNSPTAIIGSSRRFDQYPFLDIDRANSNRRLSYINIEDESSPPSSSSSGGIERLSQGYHNNHHHKNVKNKRNSAFLEKIIQEEAEALKQIQRLSQIDKKQQQGIVGAMAKSEKLVDDGVEGALKELDRLKQQRDSLVMRAESEAKESIERLKREEAEKEKAKKQAEEQKRKEEEEVAKNKTSSSSSSEQQQNSKDKASAATNPTGISAALNPANGKAKDDIVKPSWDTKDYVTFPTSISSEAKDWSKKYRDLSETINNEILPKIKSDQSLKQICLKNRLAINRRINQINGDRKQAESAINDTMVVLQEMRQHGELAYIWACNIFAQKLVNQAEIEISLRPENATNIAEVVMEIVAKCQRLWQDTIIQDVINANFINACPYVIPEFIGPLRNEPLTAYRKRLKFKGLDEEDERPEQDTNYLERMDGIVVLYLAIHARQLSGGSPGDNDPFPASYIWVWLARLVNMEPCPFTPRLFTSCLETAGQIMLQAYPSQFPKLVMTIAQKIPSMRLGTDSFSTAGAEVLVRLIEEYRRTGKFSNSKNT
ncbi:Nuclear pore complex nucleoporin component [Mycoemilia scoparia]|uniref:mRNA export factor GLE1 n=1 Tax=Mycoemilia scoparia TaxID=417184 RepID=A0A9W8A1A3_9FUNG|nr:Nuclear pore complex nucleoporin component [Mycoemilia scoparia]